MTDQTLFDRCFIGYDGSKSCHELITVFKKLHPKLQSTTIVFVYDPLKNYIPYLAKAPAIEKQIKEKVEGLENIDIKMVGKQENQIKSTNEYMLEQFFKSKSTFIMLGFYGSKGEKVRPVDLSSRIRSFVYDSKTIVAIIKNQDRDTKSVIFCCDGSEVSYSGLKKTMVFCNKFGYTLTVLHTFNQDTKTYSKQVKSELKIIQDSSSSIKFQVLIEKCGLIEYLQSVAQSYDWVILTKNGFRGEITGKGFIGSNTTQVLTRIKCNLIIL